MIEPIDYTDPDSISLESARIYRERSDATRDIAYLALAIRAFLRGRNADDIGEAHRLLEFARWTLEGEWEAGR